MKRKNPEDGKEESSKSGESSLHNGEKNLGTSKVCDPRFCVSSHLFVIVPL